ncbi:MAG: UbiA family prenyltransferase, partial [Crenarchaeota archaeon]|nr:UbiA family prenyltransferase [Thermoproteota archaeon]
MPEIGIKYGYPILRERFFDYVALTRPYTAFIAFLAGWFMGLKYFGLLTIIPALIGLTLAFGQVAGQVANQIADVAIDKINKPYRPLPSGRISISEAFAVMLIATVLSIVCAAIVSIRFLAMNIIILFFSLFYSFEPIRAKKHLWSILWIAVSRGLLPPLAVSIGALGTIDNRLLGIAIAGFTWVLAYQVTKDIGDEEGDAMFGIKTLPVVYGVKKTINYMKYMTIIVTAVVLYEIFAGLLPLFGLALLPVGACIPYFVRKATITENNMGWTLFYIGLG